MNIQFYSKNTDLNNDLKSYARKKVAKALNICGKCGEVRVEFEEDMHHNQGENTRRVEVTAYVPRDVIRLEESAAEFKAAVDLLIPKLKMQANKYKEKQETVARKNGRKFKQTIKSAMGKVFPFFSREQYIPKYEIIKRKEFSLVEAVDEDKAIEEMNKLGHDFYAFVDTKSGQNAICYKRRDGRYGVIKLKT